MVQVKKYHLPPTDLIPNSPHPVLHYPGFLLPLPPGDTNNNNNDDDDNRHHLTSTSGAETTEPAHLRLHDLFARNGWETQWIYRYGPTQPSHYHARTHEAMAVLSGTATIRFGAADREDDDADVDHDYDGHVTTTSTTTTTDHHPACYAGVEVRAEPGDVFVLPAGTAHKTFATEPPRVDNEDGGGFALLTPGDGHRVATRDGEDVRAALAGVRVSGFSMLGAYPAGGEAWDFVVGGGRPREAYEEVWAVPTPRRDPVLGEALEGICGQWK